MGRFHLTRKAVDDLAEIWDYTSETWSENQADIYYCQLLEACQIMASNPDLGRTYEDISTHLRGYRSSMHVIFYREIAPNDIEIIRFLHVRMDLKSKF